MLKTSVKLEKNQKEKLELLQAKLRLEKKIHLNQYELLGKIISFAYDHFDDFNSYFKPIALSTEEITRLEKEIIISEEDLQEGKSDDELIYGI
ncbi:MAG: hypothetical protein HeimC3_21570 [Candidatus Heimdallarchaeota archaeon LC_3]|nr:MAG: hypothetical protein HeimC3_21570 [Candidatus Heimdallarchaeota archaeon LC_3]